MNRIKMTTAMCSVVALSGVVLGACGMDEAGGDDTVPRSTEVTETTGERARTSTTAGTQTDVSSTAATARRSEWKRVETGEDCQCADGSDYSFWTHEGDPNKVVFFLEGGGACFSAESCAFTADAPYQHTFRATDDPREMGGIFDFQHAENPLADYTVVYAPYCTGDSHLGSGSHDYGSGLTVEHRGMTNTATAMNHVVEEYPDAEQLLVIGESAGGVAAPLYAGNLATLLPDAQITVLTDGASAYPSAPDVYAVVSQLWGAELPDWAHDEGGQWSVPELTARAAALDPAIRWARHDFTGDTVQKQFLDLLGFDSNDLVAQYDANETLAEASDVHVASYRAPGEEHVVLQHDGFYTEQVAGTALTDWLEQLINTESASDVG